MKFLESRDQITKKFIAQNILDRIPPVGKVGQVLKIGCDNFAIDFGNIIVRLPMDHQAWQSLQFESLVCQRVNLGDLQTPITTIVLAEYPFSWHRKIPGDYLLKADYEVLASAQQQAIADRLARFCFHLHQFSISEMKALGGADLPTYVSADEMEENRALIPKHLETQFNRCLEQYRSLVASEKDRVFGYFDAHGWNMAFDKKAGILVGIYDFADCGFGDIHQDFYPMNMISPDLTSLVIKRYELLTGRKIDIAKVNFYTVLAEYSGLFEKAMDREEYSEEDIIHHLQQLVHWQQVLLF